MNNTEDKNKSASTLISRFGFQDTDLTTPEHDKIVVFLADKENILKMLLSLNILEKPTGLSMKLDCEKCENCSWDWNKKECNVAAKKEIFERDYLEIRRLAANYNFEEDFKNKITVLLEHPIMGYNNFNIGFVDLFITQTECFCFENESFSVFLSLKNNKFVPKIDDVYVEVKPEVKSIGETIRQINMYRSHLEGAHYFVLVTRTKGLKELLKTQSIYVYEVA